MMARPTRLYAWLGALALLVAGCGSSAAAPPIDGVGEACATTSLCMGLPTDWSIVDTGDRHVTIEHPDGADATIGFIQMSRVIASAGGTGPQTPERVSRALWALFDGGSARLDQITVNDDGTVRSVGGISTGTQYHLLAPLDDDVAVGIVVRVPSRSWRTHVDAIFGGFAVR